MTIQATGRKACDGVVDRCRGFEIPTVTSKTVRGRPGEPEVRMAETARNVSVLTTQRESGRVMIEFQHRMERRPGIAFVAVAATQGEGTVG